MADEEKVEEDEPIVAQRDYSSILKLNRQEFEEGTPVDRRKALELLTARLPRTNVYNSMVPHVPNAKPSFNTDSRSEGSFWSGRGEPAAGAPNRAVLAKKILEAIPEDMLTEELLTQGDIRPFMLSVITQTDAKDGGTVGNENVSVSERAVISWILQDETEQVRTNVEFAMTSLIDPTAPGSDEALEQARVTAQNYSMAYLDGEINRVGQYSLGKDGQFEDEEGARESAAEMFRNEIKGGGTGQTPYRFLTGQQLQEMLQSDQITFDQMLDMQGQPVKRFDEFGNITSYDKIEGARVTYSSDSIPVERSGPLDPTIPVRKDWYSVTEIMQKPFEMTREEQIAIHQKMKKAGIFDIVGGEPTLEGDVTDPQFQKAWKTLASMSLETNVPMVDILKERESAYQASLEAALAISLTDPARLRLNGDAFARNAIGRKLNADEQTKMVQFLHDLERQNARTAAGLEVTATGEEIEGVDELDEGIVADIDARMEEWIAQENPGEAGARDIAEQYDSFARLLGGPGRGVG